MERSASPSREVRWWLIAALLGGGFYFGQLLLIPSPEGASVVLYLAAGPFVAGGIIGFLRPERPWRWGIAVVLPAALASLLRFGLPSFLGMGAPMMTLALVPSISGAYLGAYARGGKAALAPPPMLRSDREPAPPWQLSALIWACVWGATLGALGFAAGFVCPLVLDRGGNLGPLLGILMTGPLGAVGGFLLGALLALLRRWHPRDMALVLIAVSLLYVVGIFLYVGAAAPPNNPQLPPFPP